MINELKFSTTCTVQRNSVPGAELVLFQRGSLVVDSSSGVLVNSDSDATQLTVTMTVVSATRRDAGELKCIAVRSRTDLTPLAVQISTIHFSMGECLLNFAIMKISGCIEWARLMNVVII